MPKKIDTSAHRWCDRNLCVLPFHLCVVFSEDAYYEEMEAAKVHRKHHGAWKGENCSGTTTFEKNENGNLICIVAFDISPERTPIQIAGLIVHEACHVVDRYFREIGESRPDEEHRAYSTQWIAQEIMEQYVQQQHTSA